MPEPLDGCTYLVVLRAFGGGSGLFPEASQGRADDVGVETGTEQVGLQHGEVVSDLPQIVAVGGAEEPVPVLDPADSFGARERGESRLKVVDRGADLVGPRTVGKGVCHRSKKERAQAAPSPEERSATRRASGEVSRNVRRAASATWPVE